LAVTAKERKPVITAQQLKDKRASGSHSDTDDWQAAEKLKADLAAIRAERDPMFLTAAEFDRIVRSKLIDQYGRVKHHLDKNTPQRIERITGMALGFSDRDLDLEMTARVTVLRILCGVGMGVASAILALCDPEKYAVIDFRVWRQIFDTELGMFELAEYRRYLERLRELAEELRAVDPDTAWPIQLVDYFAWEIDKESGT
jgi:hypothetical protein